MPPRARLVRRRPLAERIKAYLNPLDFLLWLSEEFETRDWDTKNLAVPVGLGFNIVFLIAKSNAGSKGRDYVDDVFADEGQTSWFGWLCAFLVHILTLLSLSNAAYTFLRKRKYRLFEASIDETPSTPSARRVRVDSDQATASPLRAFTNLLVGDNSAESRAHPDPSRDVWEVAIWDPLPLCLNLFCLFSPGHVLVYWLFLPIAASDPRPSTTVVTTVVLATLLSAQLLFLMSSFQQQTKDTQLIHKEVLHEYDVKFVHPLLSKPVRDVGTQVSFDEKDNVVDDGVVTYSPATVIHRGFHINPNPNYAKYVDVHKTGFTPSRQSASPRTSMSPDPVSVYNKTPIPSRFAPRESSPLKPRQPQFRQSTPSLQPQGRSTGVSRGTGPSTSDGGSLGVFNHQNSPLKKASSMYDMGHNLGTPRNSREMARQEQLEEQIRLRSKSPVKGGFRLTYG